MKKSYNREILIAEVESEIPSDNKLLKEVVGTLTTAVGEFNHRKVFKDWREHIRWYLSKNWEKHFEYGFTGDHFWLHDNTGTKGKRVILIYSLNTKIEM